MFALLGYLRHKLIPACWYMDRAEVPCWKESCKEATSLADRGGKKELQFPKVQSIPIWDLMLEHYNQTISLHSPSALGRQPDSCRATPSTVHYDVPMSCFNTEIWYGLSKYLQKGSSATQCNTKSAKVSQRFHRYDTHFSSILSTNNKNSLSSDSVKCKD